MLDRDRVIRGKRKLVLIRDGAGHIHAANRVRPSKHEQGPVRLRRRFHHVTERRDVRVKTRADILYVIDERVEVLQLLRLRSPRLAVKRIDRQARLLVLRVRDLLISQAAYAMLRRKEGDEVY